MTLRSKVLLQANETHDPSLRSWVDSARTAGTDFPIQNLPFGVFRTEGAEAERVGVAIGDQILDVWASRERGAFDDADGEAATALAACAGPTLNPLMALDRGHWSALRRALQGVLREDVDGSTRDKVVLVAESDAEMVLPVDVGDYTDFYCSIHHARNVGSMFRPDNPLLPNYKHIPIGYHGRASSIVVSGTPVRRPHGQVKPPDTDAPIFRPSRLLDYELEVGFYFGDGNELGRPVGVDASEDRLFGFCLVNDWSARDVQGWEYQPLGPFLAKSFQTTVSPWIVTTEALAPFRVAAFERPDDDPQPLPHLESARNRARGGVDLRLEVLLSSERMRAEGIEPHRLSESWFRDMYWTAAQMAAHHASNGCNLRPGDLAASGTVSGPERENRGCMLELTWRGAEPIELPTGEERKFLEDGDEVILRGRCGDPEGDPEGERDGGRDGGRGAVPIGFGTCRGVVEPALERWSDAA